MRRVILIRPLLVILASVGWAAGPAGANDPVPGPATTARTPVELQAGARVEAPSPSPDERGAGGEGDRHGRPPGSIVDLGTPGMGSLARAINDRGQVVGTSGPRACLWDDGEAVDLGDLAGRGSDAVDIDARGDVLCQSLTASGDLRSFVWRRGVRGLVGTLGGTYNLGFDLNDRGQVMGVGTDAAGNYRGFLWEHRTMTDLGTLGGSQSYANAMNNRGQIAGESQTSSGVTHAFLWQDDAMRDLGTLGGNYSNAFLINDAGQVVGVANTATSRFRGFLWQCGVMTDLGTLGGTQCMPRAINARGQVVGRSELSNGAWHAFLWDRGVLTDLGTSGMGSDAFAINDRGQVVGTTATAAGIHAFLWQDGVMSDLGTLGGTTSSAVAINDRGEIVGSSTNLEGETHACLWRAASRHGPCPGPDLVAEQGPAAARGPEVGPAGTDVAQPPAPSLRVTSPPGAPAVEFEVRGVPEGACTVSVFDVRGRQIRRWQYAASGTGFATWNGRDGTGARAAAGVYFLRVDAAERHLGAKVVIAR